MTEEAIRLICEGVEKFGVELNSEMKDQISKYTELLKEKNKVVNLTAITDDNGIAIKHFVDSITLYPYLKDTNAKTLIDIGTGAGFPGLPIKIVYPEIKVTLVDSLEKRVNFLNEVINALNLKDIEAIHSRAEDIGRDKNHREKYDFATARAVSSIPVLLEYCLPLVKVNGYFAAMKGSKEEEDFNKALVTLGGFYLNKTRLELHAGDEEIKRIIYMFKKEKNTSTNYPRKAGLPAKKPII